MHSPAFLPPIPLIASHPLSTSVSRKKPLQPSAVKCCTPTPTQSPTTTPIPTPKPYTKPTTTRHDWMFFDVTRIHVRGGHGGDGVIAFRREKGVPKGGPCGGSGGRGGDVTFVASRNLNTLWKLRSGKLYNGEDGQNGSGKGKKGVCGRDLRVEVPIGTVVRTDAGRVLADLHEEGKSCIVGGGGRGGRGNLAFKSERNNAPRISEKGESGVERWVRLEMKLVADVALVGKPNAGKSSLLRMVSRSKAKVADYAFTTVVPNLGVAEGGVVIADVPGLIGGAGEGKGMGGVFLRHVERCKVVMHIVEGGEGVVDRYLEVKRELDYFGLGEVCEVVVVNKVDLEGVKDGFEKDKEELAKAAGHRRIGCISAKSGAGVDGVMKKVREIVGRVDGDSIVRVDGEEGKEDVIVEKRKEGYFVGGKEVERVFSMTKWEYIESVDRFERVLKALGAYRELKRLGAKNGDNVICGDRSFDYWDDENVYSALAALDGYVD